MENPNIPLHDVIIVGAGLSGIGAAYHIQHDCPGSSYIILEGRGAIGGTWDLFRYPGIRSDSDMYTFGFSFYPWKDPKAIADGPAILSYIRETAGTFGIDEHIRFHHKVVSANWCEESKNWTIEMAGHPEVRQQTMQCRFLFMCSGYYDYTQGYDPYIPGTETFPGPVIHPQKWDHSIDYNGKRIVVIGSGATAVTLVPELAKKAAEVTMLQRSPTYIVNMPSEDSIANFLKRILPKRLAHTLSRWKNILFSIGFYAASRKWPMMIKAYIQKNIRKELGDEFDMRHFDPYYNPWDQRLCLVPDSDLFKAIRSGKAKVVTDTIQKITPNGILLDSGSELKADIIVKATGLKIQLLGGMSLRKEGQEVTLSSLHCYKGVMFNDIPNFAIAVGYTNASWTLKCDLNATFVTRVLNHMSKHGFQRCIPRFDTQTFTSEPLLDFDAGYVRRALDILPKQGSKYPWKVYQHYIRDLWALKYSSVKDRYLAYN